MGAGIMGVTTAYFLAKKGHQVVVIEKNSASGLGCSYANGGQLSYSHIEPFASKSAISLIAKALIKPNSFLSISNFSDRNFLKWGYQFLKNCNDKKSVESSKKLLALGKKSREALQKILQEENNIKFDYDKKGILHFYRDEKTFQKAVNQAQLQQSFGNNCEILSKEECIKKEPTLVRLYDENKLIGGIYYPNDETGNGLLFIKALEKICQEKYGVIFEYNSEIKNIFTNHNKITGIHTNNGVFVANKYIYALGAYGNKLLEGIKVKTKIYPLRGYSLSIEANSEFIAPTMALTDSENKIVYSRIGDVFRAAGTIEICNIRTAKNSKQISFILSKIRSSFSDFGNINQSQEWYGFRPFRPNSIPLIGEIKKYGNLYLNTGHGHLGWTLSCGSAQIISEMIDGEFDEKFSFLEDEF